jgi:hypothetical protein
MMLYSDLIVLIHISGQNQANRGQETRSKNILSRHLDNLRQSIDKYRVKYKAHYAVGGLADRPSARHIGIFVFAKVQSENSVRHY